MAMCRALPVSIRRSAGWNGEHLLAAVDFTRTGRSHWHTDVPTFYADEDPGEATDLVSAAAE